MFRTVPLSIIRSFSLYTQQWYILYRFADSLRAGWGRAVSKPVWHIPLLCVQWKTPDDGQRNCPKHVEFYSKNKFEILVHLLGFIMRICLWMSLILSVTREAGDARITQPLQWKSERKITFQSSICDPQIEFWEEEETVYFVLRIPAQKG